MSTFHVNGLSFLHHRLFIIVTGQTASSRGDETDIMRLTGLTVCLLDCPLSTGLQFRSVHAVLYLCIHVVTLSCFVMTLESVHLFICDHECLVWNVSVSR